jgi:2-C-methyl-D-erythritol 4-phosphate cytidylyltransferase
MYQNKKIGAILLMGGEGHRFKSPIPKQFHLLKEKKIYTYALDTLLNTQFFDEIVLVCHTDWIETVQKETPSSIQVIPGGSTRQKSSYLGLKAFKSLPDIVLIHDAVRPFVSKEIIETNLNLAIEKNAVDTCIPSSDTLVFSPTQKTIKAIPNRQEYLRGQTPQTFLYSWILKAHEEAIQKKIEDASDDCRLLLLSNLPVQIVLGDEKNFKITSEFDLLIAEQLLNLETVH